MGNNKNTILVLVIVVLFIASGVVLYKGIFQGGSSALNATPDIIGAQKEIVNLLPYGSNLDFSKVKQRTGTTTTVNYETVDQVNVGVDIHSLISAASDGTATQVNGAVKNTQKVQ
jgi:uncharacterized protein (UPF0333 family)